MLSVSIAMATYNGAKHIRQQLDSLVAQTYAPSEIVITDDGSTDDTLSVIAEFSRSSPFPVRIHPNPQRLGFRANFMQAASLCRFELIAFCDQDDVWYEQKLEKCIEHFSDQDVLLVYHNADVVDGDGKRLGSLKAFAAPKTLMLPQSFNPMDPVPGFTQVFRRWMVQYSDLWPTSRDHRYENEPLAHDQWFYFLAAVLGKIAYLDKSLAAYVQHGSNTYGHSGKSDQLQEMRGSFRNPANRLSRLADTMKNRASILDQLKSRVIENYRDRAQTGSFNYRRLAEISETRQIIYSSKSFSERSRAFARLLSNSAYGGTWNLPWKSLAKDFFVGMPRGK